MEKFWEILLNFLGDAGRFVLSDVLPVAGIAVVGVVIVLLICMILSKVLEKSKLDKSAHGLIRTVVRIVLFGLLALILASRLGVDVTGVIALASVLTLAVSLALQNALSNLIGGITLLSTKPFVADDFVEIAGQSGTVQEVGLTYTKLLTPDNKVASIPNSAVVAAQITNYTVAGTRRVEINVAVDYEVPVEQVLEALKQAGRIPSALEDPAPVAAVKCYNDSTIQYLLFVWCKSEDYWTTLFDGNHAVKAVFDAKGIKMSYPHVNLHVGK